MNAIPLELMVASNGTFVVNTTAEKVANASALYVSAGTVISRIEKNGDAGTDVKADLIADASVAFLSDVLLTLPTNEYFSAVTMSTAGQVVMLLRHV